MERRFHDRESIRSPCNSATLEMPTRFKGTPLPAHMSFRSLLLNLLHNRPPLLVALPRGIHGNGMAVGGLQGQAHRLLPSFFTSICNSMVEKSTRTGCNEIMTFEPMSSLPLSSSSCSSSSSPKLESESNVTVKLAKYKTFVELEMYVHHNAAVARGSYCIKMVFLNHQRYAPKPCVS